MTALKIETAEHHLGMEASMPFFREDFNRDDYAQTLKAFFGFFDPIESLLRAAVDWDGLGLDISERCRAHLLRADLRALGFSDAQIDFCPRCKELPAVRTREAALGCMYVLEGSTLGGQIIGAELKRRFDIDCRSGASFFLSHGARVGPMWKDFCSVVRAHVVRAEQQQQAIETAKSTFGSLEAWMREVPVHA